MTACSSDAPEYFRRPDGLRLAYRRVKGAGPTLVFLPGYRSDMLGSKALALEAWAVRQGRAMLRLDYSGCGESEGAFEDGTLAVWRDDALLLIGQMTDGPIILIGSSMGGWLAMLLAIALGDRVAGLIGIAAAPDFTLWGFSDDEEEEIMRAGRLERPSDYDDQPMVTTRAFLESGNVLLLLDDEIPIDCPVRLLQGQRDSAVPWEFALESADKLRSDDVQVTLIKDGDHRLSRDQDIALLIATVSALLES